MACVPLARRAVARDQGVGRAHDVALGDPVDRACGGMRVGEVRVVEEWLGEKQDLAGAEEMRDL